MKTEMEQPRPHWACGAAEAMSEAGRQGWEVCIAAEGFLEAGLYVPAGGGLPPDHADWILYIWPPDTWPQGPAETLSHSSFSPENSVAPQVTTVEEWLALLPASLGGWLFEGSAPEVCPPEGTQAPRAVSQRDSGHPATPSRACGTSVFIFFQSHGETWAQRASPEPAMLGGAREVSPPIPCHTPCRGMTAPV